MIIGLSMSLETCRILGHVTLNSLCRKKNLQTDLCGPRGIDEKTADIQVRSFMDRNLENNGKDRQAEGEAKVVE